MHRMHVPEKIVIKNFMIVLRILVFLMMLILLLGLLWFGFSESIWINIGYILALPSGLILSVLPDKGIIENKEYLKNLVITLAILSSIGILLLLINHMLLFSIDIDTFGFYFIYLVLIGLLGFNFTKTINEKTEKGSE